MPLLDALTSKLDAFFNPPAITAQETHALGEMPSVESYVYPPATEEATEEQAADVADAQTLLVLGILYVDHPTALDTLGEHGDGAAISALLVQVNEKLAEVRSGAGSSLGSAAELPEEAFTPESFADTINDLGEQGFIETAEEKVLMTSKGKRFYEVSLDIPGADEDLTFD